MTVTREQKIRSGPRLEISWYEVWPDGRRIPERAPKEKQSTEAQQKYNHDQATKKVVRLVNANFRYGDLFTHLTWDDEHMPDSLDEVQRQIRNYIARIRYWRRKHGYDELRYLYAVECRVRRRGRYAGQYKWHVHLFMSKMPRGTAEDLWGQGRVNADRYDPQAWGEDAAAKYIAKDIAMNGDLTCGKRFAYSKNLRQPERLPPRDGKVTQRGVRLMVQKHEHDPDYWERKFPGYRFYGFEKPAALCRNPYNGFWYLTVIMYRDGKGKRR